MCSCSWVDQGHMASGVLNDLKRHVRSNADSLALTGQSAQRRAHKAVCSWFEFAHQCAGLSIDHEDSTARRIFKGERGTILGRQGYINICLDAREPTYSNKNEDQHHHTGQCGKGPVCGGVLR